MILIKVKRTIPAKKINQLLCECLNLLKILINIVQNWATRSLNDNGELRIAFTLKCRNLFAFRASLKLKRVHFYMTLRHGPAFPTCSSQILIRGLFSARISSFNKRNSASYVFSSFTCFYFRNKYVMSAVKHNRLRVFYGLNNNRDNLVRNESFLYWMIANFVFGGKIKFWFFNMKKEIFLDIYQGFWRKISYQLWLLLF